MDQQIFFSKISYTGGLIGSGLRFQLFLDLSEGKLRYQIMETGKTSNREHRTVYEKTLSAGWLNQILPLCRVHDFEAYTAEADRQQDGWGESVDTIGYRDGVSILFCGTCGKCSEIERHMDFLYDKGHEPPHEKLYQFLIKNFLAKDRSLKPYLFL